MTLSLHNTLKGKIEPFTPLKPGHVSMYVCGITPYDETHLGHARCYVVFDLLKRVFIQLGYEVDHVQNFTDVDDKIIERAKQAGVSPLDYPKKFIAGFHAHMKALNVIAADKYPLVTDHMPAIITLIEKIVKNGLAYEMEGSVYYAVRKFKGYGKLSKRKIDELAAGARVDVNEKKKDPLDFALWKASKEGEPAWESPWGKGRPGWHIECSAMSQQYLGEDFDIHGGGQDLIFPHHENEIAQSEGATGKGFAHVWVHNGFVTVNKEKMSKSLGNFFTLKDILAKYDPMVVRYFLLTQHYKSPLNFSDQELEAAKTTWVDRVCGAARLVKDSKPGIPPAAFMDALEDDLNTSVALAVLNQTCHAIFSANGAVGNFGEELMAMLNVLGLRVSFEENWEPDVLALLDARQKARAAKNWAESDAIRDKLKVKGLVVEDTANGPRLKRI